MNFKQTLAAFGLATATVIGTTASAMAGTLSVFGSTALNGFSFAKNTTVDFEFIASHGGYQSKFGVFETTNQTNATEWLFTEVLASDPGGNNANDNRGTCGDGKAVLKPCTKQFTFLAGVNYLLGLTNIVPNDGKFVFSNNPIGGADPQGMKFVEGPGSPLYPTTFKPPLGKNFVPLNLNKNQIGIFVNDVWGGDQDGNDFVLRATAVPEPATLAGLGLVAGGMLLSRRRKLAV